MLPCCNPALHVHATYLVKDLAYSQSTTMLMEKMRESMGNMVGLCLSPANLHNSSAEVRELLPAQSELFGIH